MASTDIKLVSKSTIDDKREATIPINKSRNGTCRNWRDESVLLTDIMTLVVQQSGPVTANSVNKQLPLHPSLYSNAASTVD